MSKKFFAAAVLGLLLAFGGGSAVNVATTTSAHANNVADCKGLRGDDQLECMAQRAEAEARAQCRGEGGRTRGCGRKYQTCMEYASYLRSQKSGSGFSVDSATTYSGDCM